MVKNWVVINVESRKLFNVLKNCFLPLFLLSKRVLVSLTPTLPYCFFSWKSSLKASSIPYSSLRYPNLPKHKKLFTLSNFLKSKRNIERKGINTSSSPKKYSKYRTEGRGRYWKNIEVRNGENIRDWENDKDRRSRGKKKGDFIGERTIKFRRSRRESLFGERNRKRGRKREKKIEERRREERVEGIANKNPHRTLFSNNQRSIFFGRRVFGVWILG